MHCNKRAHQQGPSKEPYIPWKVPYIPSIKTYRERHRGQAPVATSATSSRKSPTLHERIPWKEPYTQWKEPYTPWQEPYMPSKEPYIPSNEPSIWRTRRETVEEPQWELPAERNTRAPASKNISATSASRPCATNFRKSACYSTIYIRMCTYI